jgi:signal recognition particle subunit SRP54
MLDNLTQRLSRVVKTLRGQARLTEDNIAERIARSENGLAGGRCRAAGGQGPVARIKERAVGQEVIGSLTPGQALVGVVHRELTDIDGRALTAASILPCSRRRSS